MASRSGSVQGPVAATGADLLDDGRGVRDPATASTGARGGTARIAGACGIRRGQRGTPLFLPPPFSLADPASADPAVRPADPAARRGLGGSGGDLVGFLSPVEENENIDPQIDKLKSIGMEIIARCDCLPLAVKVMGGVLRQKRRTPGDWGKVLNDTVWEITKMPEELNYAIYLSYQDLHPSLKQCFLHFSILPKALRFYSDDVIGMWISEGFVEGNSRELEEIGREYYNELLVRNLIEPERLYTGQNHCTMHDLVRSFGQYVARDEVLVAHVGENDDITGRLRSHRFHGLSLCNEGSVSTLEWSALKEQKSVRTLVSIGLLKTKRGDSFVTLSSLRTIHLDSINCDALIESLYQLKHLRYLSMERCGLTKLPETIRKMKFLQYIRISCNGNLVKLPDSIVELSQLRALYLTDTRINNIPMGFNVLTNLRNLMDFPAHMDGNWCSLQELGPLSQLSVLGIDGLENVSAPVFATKAMLGKKLHLTWLSLGWTTELGDDGWFVTQEEGVSMKEQQRIQEVFDELCPPSCLDRLYIRGYSGGRLPNWMTSTAVASLENLRILEMGDMVSCTELPNGLCQLPCLEFLHIFRAIAIRSVGSEFLQYCHHGHVAVAFRRLRKLKLNQMVEWEVWDWEEKVQAMPLLEELKLKCCKLRHIPPGLAFHTRALRRLVVHNVEHLGFLENFISVVDLEVFHNPNLERLSKLPKLQVLNIVDCPKLKVLEGVPTLQRLNMADDSMEVLPTYLQDVNPRRLLLECSLALLTAIAARKSGPEWDKFSHIQQVKAYAEDEGIPREWYVLYERDPFRFETNISS